jgi:glycosyltransferase involved in cell wall biosynthesis
LAAEPIALISAVIPVHNRFEFLNETLVSVFSQARVPDEVLIVDDCSAFPVEAFLARNPAPGPVTVLRTDRSRNPGGARNWGWRRAQGDIIAFNDSDDLWEPDKTRLQAEYLEAHSEVDGVYGPMMAFFPDGRTQPWAHDRPPLVDAATALIDANMTSPTLMIRRNALEKIGGFDETLAILEDQAFAIEVGLAGLRVVFLDSPVVARVRRNDRNMTCNVARYFYHECRIALRYRDISARIYGPGSMRVHLSRALKRFGRKKKHMGLPTRLLGSFLEMSAPASRMPRL